MKLLVNFARFWYDFIVGDDWTIAVAVVMALLLTGALQAAHVAAWWLLPLVVILFLGVSVTRGARGG